MSVHRRTRRASSCGVTSCDAPAAGGRGVGALPAVERRGRAAVRDARRRKIDSVCDDVDEQLRRSGSARRALLEHIRDLDVMR